MGQVHYIDGGSVLHSAKAKSIALDIQNTARRVGRIASSAISGGIDADARGALHTLENLVAELKAELGQ
jgi:hypothetical protein